MAAVRASSCLIPRTIGRHGRLLRSLPTRLSEVPAAILVVSAHWETDGFRLTAGEKPPLVYDYYGFPSETYALRYDAPGAPTISARAAALLREHGIAVELDADRGFDHGVFVPLKVAFPEAGVPVIELSVERGLDPALHLAAGRALAPLRDMGVLVIGSGMSFHDLKGFGKARSTGPSQAFDAWLTSAVALPGDMRARQLVSWAAAPGAAASHPTAEHLLPLMVAAGTSEGPGQKIYGELVLETAVSGFVFN